MSANKRIYCNVFIVDEVVQYKYFDILHNYSTNSPAASSLTSSGHLNTVLFNYIMFVWLSLRAIYYLNYLIKFFRPYYKRFFKMTYQDIFEIVLCSNFCRSLQQLNSRLHSYHFRSEFYQNRNSSCFNNKIKPILNFGKAGVRFRT